VLGNSTHLSGLNTGLSDFVKQQGFACVYVSEDAYDGLTGGRSGQSPFFWVVGIKTTG
jgi:hypothetical protein